MKDELNVYEYTHGQTLSTYFNPLNNPTPIHPDILKLMCTEYKVGDLVETHERAIGVIKEVSSEFLEGPVFISGANNIQYVVQVGDTEKVLVGYSLKKI